MTDKTQALLPVTIPNEVWRKVDELSGYTSQPNSIMEWAQYTDRLRCALAETLVANQPRAGEVGEMARRMAKQAAENWRVPDHRDPEKVTAMVRPKDDCIYGFEQGYLAALTPSPCPGDVGMREALELARSIIGNMIGHGFAYIVEADEKMPIPQPNAFYIGPGVLPKIDAALTPSALSGDAGEGE